MSGGTEVDTEVGSNTNVPTSKKIRKARGYMLTINNPTEMDKAELETDDHIYLIYQKEKGEQGTEHLQAFIYYKNPRIFPKKKYPRAHIEEAKNIKAAIAYCQKEDTRIEGPWEQGDMPEQGRRKDLEEVARDFLNTDIETFAENEPAAIVRYHKGLKELKNISVYKHRTEPPKVFWFWGETGCGKTRTAVENHPESHYIKDGTQWWDGYEQQEAIIIDDFDGKWPFRDLLRLLDRYQYQGQIKGGYVKINSPYIYITSEFPPDMSYDGTQLEQIERRITQSGGETKCMSKLKGMEVYY